MEQQTTLTDNALHFSTMRISASSSANPIYLSWQQRYMNNRVEQTQIYDLWYCAVALAKVTENLPPQQRY